jgi:hypothetical protein
MATTASQQVQGAMVIPLVDDTTGPRSTTTKGTLVNSETTGAAQLPTPPEDDEATATKAEIEVAQEEPEVELGKFTTGQVSQHKTAQDLWIIIDDGTLRHLFPSRHKNDGVVEEADDRE